MESLGKERTLALYGEEALQKLSSAHVALFGLGGVGGYALEILTRAGIGELTLVDADSFEPSNLNRQILATRKTLSCKKAEVARQRVLEIFPETIVHPYSLFFSEDTVDEFDFSSFDFVLDAIDSVSSKLLLIQTCLEHHVPVISCMGAGNKEHPERFVVGDIYSTKGDPLAKVMRKLSKERNLPSYPVVYSEEPPLTPVHPVDNNPRTPASNPFAPASAGILLATYAIQKLMK